MELSFFKQKRLSCTLFGTWFLCLQIVSPVLKCPKIEQDKIFFSNFDNDGCQNNGNLRTDDFLQKLKKVVRIVLYGPAISQSEQENRSVSGGI